LIRKRTRRGAGHAENSADAPYRLAFEGASDLLALIRVTARGAFHVERMNPSAIAFFARALPEVSLDDWTRSDMATMFRDKARFTQAEVDAMLTPHREAVRTRVTIVGTSEIPTTSGERLARRFAITPLTNARGRVAHLLYRAEDLTGLRSAEERFRQLFDISPVPIVIGRLSDGAYLAANSAWLELHGYRREELENQTSITLRAWETPGDRARVVGILRRKGELRALPVRFRAKSGAMIDTLYYATLIEWDGETAIVAAPQDVTELMRTRREAGSQRERFESLFRLSPNPSSVTSVSEGRYLAVNESWALAMGYKPAEMLGRTSVELGLWASPEARAAFARRVVEQRSIGQQQVRFRTRLGELRDILISSETVDWDGEEAIISSMSDVTELRRALELIRGLNESLEQKVLERTTELEAANREMERFSYSVSHDLRAPLGAINGFANILRNKEGDRLTPDGARLLALLEGQSERMAILIDGLLEFSRLGRKPVTKVEIAMAVLVSEVAEEARAGEASRRAELRIAPLPSCRGDPILLRQVWRNLIGNAIKYSRNNASPLIEIGYDAVASAYFVRDNGVGFDMKYAAKLFGVFERLHGESEFEGTGIGLAHAARIVERHGGRIWCDAAPDKGATFRFTLPD